MKVKSLFALMFWLLFFGHLAHSHDLPPGFAAVEVAAGLDPVSMALAPDGRIFLLKNTDGFPSWKMGNCCRMLFMNWRWTTTMNGG